MIAKQHIITMVGGTCTALWKALQADDLLKTAILAVEGAVVSYLITLLLKVIHKKRRR